MKAHRFDRLAWRRKAGVIALAAALLALGGCVYYPDGPYGPGYYAPAPAHYGSGYYAPPPAYYGPRYYQRPYYPY